jgi:hypothetical protein
MFGPRPMNTEVWSRDGVLLQTASRSRFDAKWSEMHSGALRLCIGIKALEGALLVGTFQRNLFQPRLTIESVKEDELKRWLKPERDHNQKVSNRELEKVLAKAAWNYNY